MSDATTPRLKVSREGVVLIKSFEGFRPRAVRDAVLPGVSAFSAPDACRGGRRLLEQGPVRVKPALGIGGRGQTVVEDTAALDATVAALDAIHRIAGDREFGAAGDRLIIEERRVVALTHDAAYAVADLKVQMGYQYSLSGMVDGDRLCPQEGDFGAAADVGRHECGDAELLL